MSAGSPNTVLFILDGLGLSGKTRAMVDLALHLDRRRFRPVVATFSAERGELTNQLDAAAVPVHPVRCEDGVGVRVIARLARLMRSVRADVIHCCNPRPMLYGGLAARLRRIDATIGFLSAFACQVPDRSYRFLPQPLSTASRRNVYRNRVAGHLMRYMVTVSPSLAARFCEYNGVPLAKLRIVPYGTDFGAFDRITSDDAAAFRHGLALQPGDIAIGSVGRLVEQKDYPTQLKAFAIASQRVPGLRMILAGGGPLEPALRYTARELGVGDRVTFLGDTKDVPRLLRSLDIFVLSSKFEPFGVALLEAKAAGLAIAATRVNEIPEIVTDGESALLSPAEDPERLADSFVRLATDSGLRARLGRHAQQDARERHSLDQTVAAYQALYDTALA
jgi:glycosyltransferase involved in cell wall biosynthesis